tara:strand:+ start:506 stop:2827 length:2322 start_codon:yes stop_codon:yes gene_type:complete
MIKLNVKKTFFVASLLLLIGCSNNGELKIGLASIIPKPAEQIIGEGHFEINSNTIVSVENEEQKRIVNQAFDQFKTVAGWRPEVTIGKRGQIVLESDISLEKEGYRLKVTPERIEIKAASGAGFLYAIESLRQILPVEFSDSRLYSNVRWAVPAVEVNDQPAFGWRGYMLDVSRHFFDKEKVKEVLDFMAESKLNRFHWHLADDNGWRLEIKSYPKLTEVGAWRVDHNNTDETISNWWGRPAQKENEKATYGGFYTQEDVKEILAYAKERYIEVIPEIDMPGHAQATIAAYPEIGCVNAAPYVATGGVGENNTYNPGKKETFIFADKMLNEVMDLFPFKYVHIGGDECNKNQWKIDPHAQKRMKEEGLKNEHELQSYFLKRIEKIINKRDRIMIGWDEILEGGLAPNATVMSWRGESGGIKSAKMNHDVIMTPSNYCYIDLKQGHDDLEPNLGYSELLLSKSYSYKVIPDDLTKEEGKHILGIQANMWTESISDWSKLTYMTFPRLYAIAESGWTANENKNWNDFTERLDKQLKRLDIQKVRYAKSAFSPWIDHKGNGETIEISLKTEVNNLDVRYTLNGDEPTAQSEKYVGSFIIDKGVQLKARSFQDGVPIGNVSEVRFPIHKAKGVSVLDANKKELPKLSDLNYGKLNNGDPYWQKLEKDASVKLVFDEVLKVKTLKFNSLRFTNSAVYPPEKIEVYGSKDGTKFIKIGSLDQKEIAHTQGRNKIESSIQLQESDIKELRIDFVSVAPIPEGHRRAGGIGALRIDEIVVE